MPANDGGGSVQCRAVSGELVPVIGGLATEDCAENLFTYRAQTLFALLDGASVPHCTTLAARVWLLARTSLERGEVFQRDLLSWVLLEVVFPFFRAANRRLGRSVRRVGARRRTYAALDAVNEVAAWAGFRDQPRGAEHWEPLVAWWTQRIADEEDEIEDSDEADEGPVWTLRAARIAADAMQAASAISCSAPRAFADALARIVDLAAHAFLKPDLSIYAEASASFAARFDDDLQALCDERASHIWAALDGASGGQRTWDGAVLAANAIEIADALRLYPLDSEAALETFARACNEWAADLGRGLSPFEVVATRALDIGGRQASALKLEGYLVLMMKEARFPAYVSLVAAPRAPRLPSSSVPNAIGGTS